MNDADYVAAFQRILLPVAYEVQQAVLYIHYMVYYLYIYIHTFFQPCYLLTYTSLTGGPLLETLDLSLHVYVGNTPSFLYFDLYLNTAYAGNNYYLPT